MAKTRREYRRAQYETPRYRELQGRLRANVNRCASVHDWSQRETAAKCGMTPQHFNQLVTGKSNVTFTTLCRIADALDVDVAELIAPLERPAALNDRAALATATEKRGTPLTSRRSRSSKPRAR